MPNIEKRKGSGQEVFEPKDLVLELIEAGKVGSLADRLTNDEINEILKAFSTMKQAKAKGGNVEKQMELFQDGGLKDEGNTKDPVSGNDVPPGATQEEVRDDIPAQLSEGEFVFPADVVRYIGLEKLMMMRQEAKMGLKTMERMGQMGNAEEATIPDDMPFSIIDIEIAEGEDDEVEERAQGGVIEAANGFAGTTTTTNPLQTRAPSTTASPTGLKTAYTAPVIPTATASPIGGFTYKSPIDTTKKATYTGLFGGDELTQGPDEYRTYVNDAGAEIQIPFKNGKILTGFSIPQGFKPQTDDPRDTKIQTAKTKTARVEQETGGDDGDSELSDLGGARTTIGGVEYAVQYNFDGTVGLQSLTDYRNTGQRNFKTATPDIADKIKTQTLGQIAQLAYAVKPQAKLAVELAKKLGVKIPGRDKLDKLIKESKDATTELDNISISGTGIDDLTKEQQQKIQDAIETGKGTEQPRAFMPKSRDDYTKETEKRLSKLPDRSDVVTASQTQQVDSGSDDPSGGFSESYSSPSGETTVSESGYGTSGGPGDFKQGGLAKRKTKVKKMKRGGLASR